MTTPNSAKCWMEMISTPNSARIGLMTMPAIKYPSTDPSPRREAIGTAMTPAIKKINARRRKSVIHLCLFQEGQCIVRQDGARGRIIQVEPVIPQRLKQRHKPCRMGIWPS